MSIILKNQKKKVKKTYENKPIFAIKLYPGGVTTNSDSCVKDLKILCLFLK